MSILGVLVVLAIFGFIVWLITLINMPETIRMVIIGIACLIAVVFALQLLGVHVPGVPTLRLV